MSVSSPFKHQGLLILPYNNHISLSLYMCIGWYLD